MMKRMIFVLLLCSCTQGNQFEGSGSSRQRNNDRDSISEETNNENPNLTYKELAVTGNENSGDVDIVWVVDESPSMKDERDIVKSNLSRFENSIARLTSVSSFVSFNHAWDVGSSNALECVLEGLRIEDHRCLDDGAKYLDSFFRESAKKVFIFVTDDESDISASEFKSKMNSYDDAIYYAFVGKSETECPETKEPGYIYISLAQSSGGEAYSICKSDWSDQLESLSSSIITSVSHVIDLGLSSSEQVVEVILNGKKLDPSKYEINGNKIAFKEGFLKESDTLKIGYK